MPEGRKTNPPKSILEFWNLMSLYENRVSAWFCNNTLENRLMRWFIWVTQRALHSTHNSPHNTHQWLSLHRVPMYRYLKQGASCLFSPLSVSLWSGWIGDKHATTICHNSTSPFCPVGAWNRDAICLSHWSSLLERQQLNQARTNYVLQTPPRCVTFDHACTVDMVVCLPEPNNYCIGEK